MRREALPIEGFCVAAGIPTTEKAIGAIGSHHGRYQAHFVQAWFRGWVVNIAASDLHFPVILQWTGGHARGRHSCEDVHQPILSTRSSICHQVTLQRPYDQLASFLHSFCLLTFVFGTKDVHVPPDCMFINCFNYYSS